MNPRTLPLLVSLLSIGAFATQTAGAQALPAGTQDPPPTSQAVPASMGASAFEGYSLPDVGGTLRYSLTASETAVFGYNGSPGTGSNTYTNVGGNLAYLSRSEKHPFAAVYSGGYLIGNGNFPSYYYQNLSLSQGYHARRWDFVVADSISYLPETATTGLSGIPGSGDLNIEPVQVNSGSGIGILTDYAPRVNNVLSGTATYRFTGSTWLSATGAYELERYIGEGSTADAGVNNDEEIGSLALMHRLSGKSDIGASYSYTNSNFQYVQLETAYGTESYQTHTVQGIYDHRFNAKFRLAASAGPQWLVSSGSLVQGTPVTIAASASLTYTGKRYISGVSYTRSINNGNGVVVGSESDVIAATASRTFYRRYNVAGMVGWNRSTSLPGTELPSYTSDGVVAGGQVTTVFRRKFAAFASYTLQRQTFEGTSITGNAYNGLSNYVTVGLTFSPPALFTRR